MSETPQSVVPTVPEPMPQHQGANVDAHLAQVPGTPTSPVDVVFGLRWNPATNTWDPADTPHDVTNLGTPGHGDDPNARPMINDPGSPSTYTKGGGAPDPRANLLTSVQASGPTAAPPTEIHHTVETSSPGNDRVRARTVRVELPAVGGSANAGTVLLEENPRRIFALIKCVTTNGVILLQPGGQGAGGVAFPGIPTAPNAGFEMATGDPVLKMESTARVEAIPANTGTQPFCDVTIWEEMSNTSGDPGIGT